MAKKYEFSDELLEHIEGLHFEIMAIQNEELAWSRNPRALKRLYGDYLRSVIDLHALAEEHPQFSDDLQFCCVFLGAYLFPSAHMSTRDRALLIAMFPEFTRTTLKGSRYEYRREE